MNKCYRCKKKATQSWNICSDGNKLRWVCLKCDVEINEMLLKFFRFRNWKSKIEKYKKEMDLYEGD